jgi:hypothetical protein
MALDGGFAGPTRPVADYILNTMTASRGIVTRNIIAMSVPAAAQATAT